MAPEPNKIMLMVRGRGSGKTPTIIGDPAHNVPSLAQIYIKKGMKAIVIDSEDHPNYRNHVTNIKPGEDINKLPPGFYRIYGTHFDAMYAAINTVWNAFLIFEDPRKYMGTQLKQDVRAILLATKNRNCDTLLMFQSWGYVISECIDICDGIDLAMTADSPEERKTELKINYAAVKAAWDRCMESGDKHRHEYVTIQR